MSGGVLALMVAGLLSFGAGAYLAATGARGVGIGLMATGLMFQVLTLVQMRRARHMRTLNSKGSSDAG